MKYFQHKSSKEFACHRPRKDVPAVHLLPELAGRMERLNLDHDSNDMYNQTQEAGHVTDANSNMSIFDESDDCDTSSHGKKDTLTGTHFLESKEIASTTRENKSHQSSLEVFFLVKHASSASLRLTSAEIDDGISIIR